MKGPVLVFDSGVGGLSVAAAIRHRLPEAALAYVCDNAMLPYGTKPDAWLVGRIVDVCLAGVEACSAGVLVVACNTASTLALAELRSRLDIPVVGTVPAIKPAAMTTRSGTIGLLATSATVNRPYTDALIRDFAAQCRVIRVAADGLVTLAERKLAGLELDEALLAAELAPLWKSPELDTVVLGCTHFPLLVEQLRTQAPKAIEWIDSGAAIARRVISVVPEIMRTSGSDEAWATAPSPALSVALSSYGFAAPQWLEVQTLPQVLR
ncbi:glutamate racemase [Halomonas sp. McH1-25]|uniref:glutamate racemase n=1 Tax=unclassified Halomonas TaxID=2609666 RepID=UPI001EF5C069|nr:MULTISPECIES: glutamate racemase [unclassified Halomonas]MCG7600938.1 glutamate racemase [Halomonas sp. McH1-25]MCP1341526.1 glutamate racemase [Halomonas sp. FL8]MCP1359788.1 glutamate racemase [Halomonas sp. BBD45]MCP1365553.1 glutamate racemase [Halomonas sp. BBD48]